MFKTITILFFMLGCASCYFNARPSKVVTRFFSLSKVERIRQFKGYSLEEQFEIYSFGNRIVHPPATYLAVPFAERGVEIIPFLKKKLEVEKDEAGIRDILLVLSKVAQLNIYDFKKDFELTELLKRKVDSMKGIWKDIAIEFLAEITTSH